MVRLVLPTLKIFRFQIFNHIVAFQSVSQLSVILSCPNPRNYSNLLPAFDIRYLSNRKVYKDAGFNIIMLMNEKRVILNENGRKFLRELRLSNGLPEIFKTKYSSIIKWENGKNNPTLSTFYKYLSFFSINIESFKDKNFITEILPSVREMAVQKTTKIPQEKHKLLIEDYGIGLTLEKISKKYGCTPSNVFYILKRYDVDTAKHGSGEKYHFPESNYIKYLINQNISRDEVLPLISSLLFTDGCLYKHKKGFEISYYGTDKTLHEIFADLIWYCFKTRPSSYMIKCGSVLRTKYINRKIAEKVLELSPSYKTKPASKENWEEFLRDNNKPNLDFMRKYNDKVAQEFIRLAMCADGCISVSNKKDNIFFTLILACSHPILVKYWSELFSRVGIKNNIVKGSGKTKIGGVKGIEDSISKFYEIGGFIPEVKVCVQKSPLYGIEKQKILSTAVRLLKEHNRINTLPVNFKEFENLL